MNKDNGRPDLRDPAVVAHELSAQAALLRVGLEAETICLADIAGALAFLLEAYAGQARTAAQMIEARKRKSAGGLYVPTVTTRFKS